MSEDRKVFPMNAFVSYLKGSGKGAAVTDMVGFMTSKEIDEDFAPFAAALAKAWIYEQHPELVKMAAGELAEQGQNVSLSVLPAETLDEVNAIFDKLACYKASVNDLTEKLAKAEKELAEKTAILADTDTRCKAAEAKATALEASAKDAGEKVIVASEAKVTEYIGKVDELLKMIEDVKKHGVVTVASGAAPAGGAAAGAPETGGAPAADFGFGSDPFSEDDW